MDMDLRDVVRWIVWALSLGGLFEWTRGSVKKNRDDITKLYSYMLTDNHEPRFISYRAHDKICGRHQATQQEIKDHLEKNDKKLEAILVAVTTLQAGQDSDRQRKDK